MRTYTVKQKAELAKAWPRLQWLIEINYGGGVVDRISHTPLTAADSFDGYAYEARIVKGGLGKLVFAAGSADDKTSIKCDASDGHFKTLEDAGTVIENAKVAVHLFFPSLVDDPLVPASERAYANFWCGHVVSQSIDRDIVTLELGNGLYELTQAGQPAYQSSCHKLFADGKLCPYAPLDGKGLPTNLAGGTSTNITGMVLTDTGKDFVALGLEADHYLFAYHASDPAQVAIGIIQTVTTTTLTVDSWRLGGTPATGWKYVAGPAATDCGYGRGNCIALGMFGPSEVHPAGLGINQCKRRFFGGLAPSAQASWQGHEHKDWFSIGRKGKAFSWIPNDNVGLEGKSIPIRVGAVSIPSLDLLAVGSDGERIWGLFNVGAGRCGGLSDILPNVSIDNDDSNGAYSYARRAAVVTFGFGTQDGAATDLTDEQKKCAIGSRAGYARYLGEIDSDISCPYIFADDDGAGPSKDGLSLVAVRCEPPGAKVTNLELQASAVLSGGVYTRKADGTWTTLPCVPEFAYWYLRHPAWGGLTDDQIELPAALAAAVDAREVISITQTEFPTVTGSVGYGPSDLPWSIPAEAARWIWVPATVLEQSNRYIGGKLTIGGETHIVNDIYEMPKSAVVPPDYGGGYGGDPPDYQDEDGYYVSTDDAWTIVPGSGDGFTLAPSLTVSRYMANGNLVSESTKGETLTVILKNCAGTWFQSAGKIKIVIKKQQNLTIVNARPTLTDTGVTPTVAVRDGKSTAHWKREAVGKAPNSITVEFCDRQNSHVMTSFEVKNTAAQKALKDRFADRGRDKRQAKLSLPLTDSIDQALRLAALELRTHGQRADGSHTGPFELQSSIHDLAEMEPLDAWPVALDGFPAWLTHGLPNKVTFDPESFLVDVELDPYVHSDWVDSATDVSSNYQPAGIGGRPGVPRVIIESLTEGTIKDNHDKLVQSIAVEITLPTGRNKPIKGIVAWKYRSEPISRWHAGTELTFNYVEDSNAGLAGVQNQATIWDIPFLPDSEIIDVLAIPDGAFLTWRPSGITTQINELGGITDEDQIFTVDPFGAGRFVVGTTFLFDDTGGEIATIIGINGNDLTVRRGEHGTTAVAHSDNCVLRRLECSVDLKSITMLGVLAGLPAPSNLVADGIADAIQNTWTSNLSEVQFKQLDHFQFYYSTSAIPPDGAGASTIPLAKESSYAFVPPIVGGKMDGAGYYSRVSAVDISGVESALSNQAGPEAAVVTIPKIAGPSAPVCLLAEGGGKSLLTRANRASATDWLANIASCRLEIYKGSTPSSDETPADPRQGYIDDTDQPFTYQLGGQDYGNYWARARVTDSLGQVSTWGLSSVLFFDPTTSTPDTAVMDRAMILMDVDTYQVDSVQRTNTVKYVVAENPAADPSQDDSADIVEVQLTHSSTTPAFTAAAGFENPDFTEQAKFETVTVFDAKLLAIWRYWLTAKVHNSFGWSQWCDPVEYTVTVDPTVSPDDDVPTLDKFAVWTPEEPPTPADSKITGLTMRYDGELTPANSNVVFSANVQAYPSQSFPEDDVLLNQASGTCTAVIGSAAVAITGLASPVTLNQYAAKGFRFGRAGYKNVGQILVDSIIASNTASPEGAPPYSTVLTLQVGPNQRNNGAQTYWSIINAFQRDLLRAGGGDEWIEKMDVTGGGSAPQRHFFSERHIVNIATPLYFRACAHGEYGTGAWRYATTTDTGTLTAGLSTLKKTTGIQTADVKDAAITAKKQSKGTAPTSVSVDWTAISNVKAGWSSGEVGYADESTEAFNAGDTGTLAVNTTYWIYKISGNATLQVSDIFTDTIGNDRSQVAIVRTTSNTAEKAAILSSKGTSVITAAVGVFGKLSSLSADLGEVTAGTMTGALIRTAASGARVQLDTSGGVRLFDGTENVLAQLYGTGLTFRVNDATPGYVKFGSDSWIYAIDTEDTLYLSPQSDSHGALTAGTPSERWLSAYLYADYTIQSKQQHASGKYCLLGMGYNAVPETETLSLDVALGAKSASIVVQATGIPSSGITLTADEIFFVGTFNTSNISSGTLSTDRFSAYADLVAESKIGTGGTQVAQGDHTHPGSMGDVYGPASATDHAIARFDGTTGKLIQNSGVTIDDSGNLVGVSLSAGANPGLSAGDISATGIVYGNSSGNLYLRAFGAAGSVSLGNTGNGSLAVLNSTGLGIGCAPGYKLDVLGHAHISGDGYFGVAGGAAGFVQVSEWSTYYVQLGYADAKGGAYLQGVTDVVGGNLVLNPDGGNVGIGCTPSYKLQIHVGTGTDGIHISRTGGPDWQLMNYGPFHIQEAGIGPRLTVAAGGKTGIGTADPQRKLDVFTGGAWIRDYSASGGQGLGVIAGNPGSPGEHILDLFDKDATLRMVVQSDGMVGIGKTPATALDVNGTVTATLFSGSGASLTSLNATNVSSGTLSTDRFSAYADLVAESKIGTGAAQVAQGDHTHAGYVTVGDITYENLDANGDVGTGAGQLAIGNHSHSTYVIGPGVSYDNAVVRFHSTTGYMVQNSEVLITDGGTISTPQSLHAGDMIRAAGETYPPASGAGVEIRYNSTDGGLVTAYDRTGLTYKDLRIIADTIRLQGNNNVSCSVGIVPASDNAYPIGGVSFRWSAVYATNFYGSGVNLTGLAPTSHAVNASTYGYGDATNAGHLRVGTGLSVTTGTISVNTAWEPTYENLDANGDVGTGAGQLAIGNHSHQYEYLSLGGGIMGGSVRPQANNSYDLGTSTYKWADVESVLINGADIGFANSWKFREYPLAAKDVSRPNEWMREHANKGIQLLNDKDELIAVFHRDGTLYVRDVKPLSELFGSMSTGSPAD